MKTKKIISLAVCILMLISVFPFAAGAQNVYPESEHDYANNYFGEWSYVSPEPAKALLVTFSDDTWVEERNFGDIIFSGSDNSLHIGDIVNSPYWGAGGDYIALVDASGETVGIYDGDELAGKTVFIAGDSFTVKLVTDDSVTGYGFRVTDVKVCNENDMCEVTFHPAAENAEPYTRVYRKDSVIYLPETFSFGYNDFRPYKKKLAGWGDTADGALLYNPGAEITLGSGRRDIYAKWAEVALGPEEIFYFNNSRYYFVLDGENRYVMTQDDFRMLQLNLFKTYGPGPVPNPILAIVLYTYPDWEWRGSCFGIAAVTALQHLGYINILPMQNAACMNNMKNDRELLSTINYYQANAATSYLTENKAVVAGNRRYAQSLKYLFNTAKAGNIAIFTFYQDVVFTSPGHTVLITGAYDDADGNHVLIAYDSNAPYSYYRGSYDSEFIISPDYKTISYSGESLGAINWTDNFEQFKAFDIEGNTDVLSWYRAYFLQLKHYFERLFELFADLFRV